MLLEEGSFVDLIADHRILIKHDRVAGLTTELRNKKYRVSGSAFQSVPCARRKDKAKDQVLHATKNAIGS